MAVETQVKASTDGFSLSSLMLRLRSKRRKSAKVATPQDKRLPLRSSPLPLVLPEHQPALSNLGWTTITLPTQPLSETESDVPSAHPLQEAYEALFRASAEFFDLPDVEKSKWKTKLGSEEGWSKIPGEKEFITLRTLAYTPDVLKEAAEGYWKAAGGYMDGALGRVSQSLAMSGEEDEGLRRFVGPCKRLGEKEEDKTATMLRLFRYEGDAAKVVAEPHADLGLLSMVVGDVPGLEVWNQRWIPIEQTYTTPCATLLAGRQLERLSNYRYPAGGHRVVSYSKEPTSTPDAPNYRFSIVFVMRAHEPVSLNTDTLETEITGLFGDKAIRGGTAGDLYDGIRRSHFNINTGIAEREEQRKRIAENKRKSGITAAG